jgi:hypothetical protein
MQTHSKMQEYIAHRIVQQFAFADPEGLLSAPRAVTSDLQTAVSSLRIVDRNGQSYRIIIEAE